MNTQTTEIIEAINNLVERLDKLTEVVSTVLTPENIEKFNAGLHSLTEFAHNITKNEEAMQAVQTIATKLKSGNQKDAAGIVKALNWFASFL